MILEALDWIGAALVVTAMWAALQFEGAQMESAEESDEGCRNS